MSSLENEPEAPLEAAADALVRSALLRRPSAVPDPDDMLQAAELLLTHAQGRLARALMQSAFIRKGFSPQLTQLQADFAARTGLWALPARAVRRQASGTGIEIAVAEMRMLADRLSVRALPARPVRAWPSLWAADVQSLSQTTPPADTAELTEALYVFLCGPEPSGSAGAEQLLRALSQADLRTPELDFKIFAPAPLELLVRAVCFASLQAFLTDNRELAFGEYGSPALLHAAARLDSSGLGPYISNVHRIAARSLDVFELARCAVRPGGLPLERWVVLLARNLSGSLLDEVVDDLGDADALAPLTEILERAARRPRGAVDRPLVWRIRDAALDNGRLALAARAQELVAMRDPDNLLEQIILADIRGTEGDDQAVEQILIHCLRTAPDYGAARDRLRRLKSRRYDAFKVTQGYGSPQDRMIYRLRRRQAPRAALAPAV